MSRSLRARGLKLIISDEKRHKNHVALFTGAWIEILVYYYITLAFPVALFTGAWIEINLLLIALLTSVVALFTGAWIEINQ